MCAFLLRFFPSFPLADGQWCISSPPAHHTVPRRLLPPRPVRTCRSLGLACPLSAEHLPPPECMSHWSGITYVQGSGQHPSQPLWHQHGQKGQMCHTGILTARQLLPGLGSAAPWHCAGHKGSGTQYRPQRAKLPQAHQATLMLGGQWPRPPSDHTTNASCPQPAQPH